MQMALFGHSTRGWPLLTIESKIEQLNLLIDCFIVYFSV